MNFSKNTSKFFDFLLIISAVVTVGITVFILWNATAPPLKSGAVSNSVKQVVEPVVREPIEAEVGKIGEEKFVYLFRKAGHIVEYAALSMAVFSLVIALKKKTGRFFGGTGAFYCLTVANLDEYIQGFAGRSSLVKDVFIDVCGIAVGAVLVGLVWLITEVSVRKIRKN